MSDNKSQSDAVPARTTPKVSFADALGTKKETTHQQQRRAYKQKSDGAAKPNHMMNTSPKEPTFQGRCDGLKGHIYDSSTLKQAGIFSCTTREIAEYVGANYKEGSNVRMAIENMTLPILDLPNDLPSNASPP